MGRVTLTDLETVFTYQSPEPTATPIGSPSSSPAIFTVGDQLEAFEKIRVAAIDLARTILEVCPESADQAAAVRLVREARMTANAAIALRGRV